MERIDVLNDGFIRLVDVMGNDSSIVRAARVSYGAGTKSVSDDEALIRYLMRNYHTTPFEMVEFVFHVRVPMDTWRQWIRHRTANVNEYSTRYSEAIDSQATTNANEWRIQASNNKQGSCGYIDSEYMKEELDKMNSSISSIIGDLPPFDAPYNHIGEYLTDIEKAFLKNAKEVYQERLKFGVAREQARKDLPLSTYTEAYWKIDLHNLLHFLRLRIDSHAQFEIREYANAMGQIVRKIVPVTWQAFLDYRVNAIALTSADISALQELIGDKITDEMIENSAASIKNKRERQEYIDKVKRLKNSK